MLLSALMGFRGAADENSYHLVGTVESKGFTGAVVITSDGKQAFYRLRETIPNGAQLVQVHSDSISVKSPEGSRYEMFISLTAVKLPSASALR